jgi:hypothetical protein
MQGDGGVADRVERQLRTTLPADGAKYRRPMRSDEARRGIYQNLILWLRARQERSPR